MSSHVDVGNSQNVKKVVVLLKNFTNCQIFSSNHPVRKTIISMKSYKNSYQKTNVQNKKIIHIN